MRVGGKSRATERRPRGLLRRLVVAQYLPTLLEDFVADGDVRVIEDQNVVGVGVESVVEVVEPVGSLMKSFFNNERCRGVHGRTSHAQCPLELFSAAGIDP